MAWNRDLVSVTNAVNRTFTISAVVQTSSPSIPFLITTCYGPSDDSRKEEFLAELRAIKPATTTPWIIMGDFNLIYQASDKNNLNLNRRLMGKFRRTLDDCELMEIALQNRKYTWSNERENPTLVRLDRVFYNSEGEDNFPNFALTALATGASDHCLIFLARQDRAPRKANFRFENHWLKIDGFKEVVLAAWTKPQLGSAHTVLSKKLSETARALRNWSKPLFSNARLQLHIANEVIYRLDLAQEDRRLTDQEISLRHDLKIRVLGLAAIDRSRRRRASRITYIKSGDACTRFFHLRMAARKRRQYIPSLKNQDGSMVWAHDDKKQVLQDYFERLIGSKVRRLRTFQWSELHLEALQQLPGLELDRPFTESEIANAVKCLPREKAPGTDGFTSDFYVHCWEIIKYDILSAFHAFYIQHSGSLEHLNRAQVVLIPKVDIAFEPKDFRPISLVHSLAKLLTKVLANRLAVYIDKLISTSQSAFIKRRCIQENFMYVRGLARHYHRTRTHACLIKLDITKAFDSVSWEYLIELLGARGFPTRWLNWLAIILSTSSSAILLNGCPCDNIRHRRGLRQGDPLSPYLFILAIDVLNNIFELATQQGFLSKLKGRQAKLRISMYADDAVIFSNPRREDITCIMEIMKAFGEATGLQINMHKSSVATIRCAGLDMDDILQNFPGLRVNFPLQYLGLPLTLGRLKMVHLQYIQDRAKRRVAGWQGRLLNAAGRRELVCSVLSSLPVYLLTAVKVPNNFIKDFDKIRRKFLWAGDKELTGGKCKVAWVRKIQPCS